MPSQSNEVVCFGPFEADLKAGELRKHGVKLKLSGLPFRLLVTLLERSGEVVTREELQEALWPPETYVDFERGLGTALNRVRETLGDSATTPRFIETIPRRGYRFIAEVKRNGSLRGAAVAPTVRRGWKSVVVFSVLAVLAAGAVLYWRSTQAKPLTDKDVLVLADFTNETGDPVFDGTLREALAFQLEQSPFLKVLDDDLMRRDLQLMGHSDQEHVSNKLAHEICVREAEKAMLDGSIASLGKSYYIELKATNCQSGAILARQEAEATDKEHILEALAKAAQAMRAKLGESLSSIQKMAPPDFGVTTSSLEAFQAFAAGLRLFLETRFSESIPLLQRATELDPNFAMAWSYLASASLNNGGGGNRQRFQEYNEKAWALRDRISPYERLRIDVSWYDWTRPDKLPEFFESWARIYPRDAWPHQGLGSLHLRAGEFEEALPQRLEAYRLKPLAFQAFELMDTYVRLDRFAEAKEVAEKVFARGLDGPRLHEELLLIAYAGGDQEGAAKEFQWFIGKPEEYLGLEYQAAHARMVGQLRQSRELLQRAAELARRRNLLDVAARLTAPNVDGDALLGNCGSARKTGAASPVTLALCGDESMVERAEKQAEERSKQRPNDTLWNAAQLPLIRAAIEFGRGQPAKALDLLQFVKPYERAYSFAIFLRGLALLRLKKGTEAATEFQKIVDHKGANWGPLYPLSHAGLARGAALAGDTARSRRAYESFFGLWKDADPDVPILIQTRKEHAGVPR
jgi:eukaryotic-like serine/threonine-protein kinase